MKVFTLTLRLFLQFLKDILSLDIPSEDLSTLLESNNPILNSWFCSLTNLPSGESPHPFLEDYLEEYRARLGAMREVVGSGGMVERLYEGTNDPNFVKAMTSSIWYDLTHSSPWACDAGLEERHKELSAREDNFDMSQSSFHKYVLSTPKWLVCGLVKLVSAVP